jgi:hypothetical protein
MRDRLRWALAPLLLLFISGCFDSESPVNSTTTPLIWVIITSPALWSSVYGLVEVHVEAGPEDQVQSVDLFVDGQPVLSDSVAPYLYSWDAGSLTTARTLFARARGESNTSDSELITVSVQDTSDHQYPAIILTWPAMWTLVPGVIQVRFEVTDNVGINHVELLVDGALQGTMGTAPYYYNWDPAGLDSGNHTLLGKAFDFSGNESLSNLVTVTTP